MIFSTIEVLPNHLTLSETKGFIEHTIAVKVSSEGILGSLLGSKKDPRLKAYAELERMAIEMGANGIIGIQVSTTMAAFKDGMFIYETYYGTAVVIEDVSPFPVKG